MATAQNLRASSTGSSSAPPPLKHLRLDVGLGQVGVHLPEQQTGNAVNYGNRHPHDDGSNNDDDQSPYEKMRISFESRLDGELQEVLERDVLPDVKELWTSALSVVRVEGNLMPYSTKCGEMEVPVDHLMKGVADSDLVVYLSSNKEYCHNSGAYASVCEFDQYMRPTIGNIVICTDEIDINKGTITANEKDRLVKVFSHQLGQILGLSTNLFQHYRNPETGLPWGSTKKSVTCTDGASLTLDVPNILQQGMDEHAHKFFQVTTPTVVQTVRNHFDCQMLSGARLESSPNSLSCFGSHLDERFYFQENFSNLKTHTQPITPLSLAILQDSSWYDVDFTAAVIPSFGHGMGCAFLEGDCVLPGKIPQYSKGHFCTGQDYGCDVSHDYKAACDAKPNTFTSQYEDTNFCPMKSRNIITCKDPTQIPSQDGEIFGETSKCFETSKLNSICLEATCNAELRKVEFNFNGKIHQCEGGEMIDSGLGFEVECPELKAVCPDLICPANCSGRGMCDHSLENPICICDDPFNETPGCYGSSI